MAVAATSEAAVRRLSRGFGTLRVGRGGSGIRSSAAGARLQPGLDILPACAASGISSYQMLGVGCSLLVDLLSPLGKKDFVLLTNGWAFGLPLTTTASC